jgi:hypothetical protein
MTTSSKSIQTSIHGSRIGLSQDNELLIQLSNGLSEVAYRPSDLSGVTINTVTGLSGKTGKVSHDTLVLTFTNVAVTLADEAGVVAYGGVKIADLPATSGHFGVSAVVDLVITKSSAGVNADWDGDISIGTSSASNNATLTSTEANILTSNATPQAVAGVSTVLVGNNTHLLLTAQTAQSVYLNLLVDDADHNVTVTPCNLILNGTVFLTTTEYDPANY